MTQSVINGRILELTGSIRQTYKEAQAFSRRAVSSIMEDMWNIYLEFGECEGPFCDYVGTTFDFLPPPDKTLELVMLWGKARDNRAVRELSRQMTDTSIDLFAGLLGTTHEIPAEVGEFLALSPRQRKQALETGGHRPTPEEQEELRALQAERDALRRQGADAVSEHLDRLETAMDALRDCVAQADKIDGVECRAEQVAFYAKRFSDLHDEIVLLSDNVFNHWHGWLK